MLLFFFPPGALPEVAMTILGAIYLLVGVNTAFASGINPPTSLKEITGWAIMLFGMTIVCIGLALMLPT
jgi:uncharacterized membrane protein YjfL (UPF0719 family)